MQFYAKIGYRDRLERGPPRGADAVVTAGRSQAVRCRRDLSGSADRIGGRTVSARLRQLGEDGRRGTVDRLGGRAGGHLFGVPHDPDATGGSGRGGDVFVRRGHGRRAARFAPCAWARTEEFRLHGPGTAGVSGADDAEKGWKAMGEIVDEISRVHREVGTRRVASELAGTVLLRRAFDAEVAEVWSAVTSPERIARWFLPVTGEFRAGGSYQLEGNAGGEILECLPRERLRVSWLFGPDPAFSEVEVRLAPEEGGGTVFELEHVSVVPEEFRSQYGPGAVGVGWDLALLGLGWHLAGGGLSPEDAVEWEASPEAKAFVARSGEEWGRAFAASGADPETVTATTVATVAFYTGE